MGIRLIACDMDGTLLDSQKRLPAGFMEALTALEARGIAFAIASGRQYAALARDLKPFLDRMYFICENGALIMYRGRRIHIDPMRTQALAEVIRAARGIEGTYPIVCRAELALLEQSADPAFLADTLGYYPSQRVVPDLMAYCGCEDVCKVAIYDPRDAQTHALPALRRALEPLGLTVVLSGENWVDIMDPSVNKGAGMRALQRAMGVVPEECMAFGDYLNDCELLAAVSESYAMKNAHPLLLSQAKFIAPSNDEDGVLSVLRGRFCL